MTEYTAVPTAALKAQQEARELDNLNQITRSNREKREKEARDIEADDTPSISIMLLKLRPAGAHRRNIA